MATGDKTYTPAIADEILRRLAAGESLRGICRTPGFPSDMTVRRWVIYDVEGFASQYAQARDLGLDVLAEEALEIADTPQTGTKRVDKPTGSEVHEGDMIEHRRLRVDTRKWYLSKLAPKKYGDKQEVTHKVEDATTERLLQGRNRTGG